jgi:hypothetical protein
MARMLEWQLEAHEARRKEVWTLRGPTQIVKVGPLPSPGTGPKTEVGGVTMPRPVPLGLKPCCFEDAPIAALEGPLFHGDG